MDRKFFFNWNFLVWKELKNVFSYIKIIWGYLLILKYVCEN